VSVAAETSNPNDPQRRQKNSETDKEQGESDHSTLLKYAGNVGLWRPRTSD